MGDRQSARTKKLEAYPLSSEDLGLPNVLSPQVNLQVTHSIQSESSVFFVMGIEGLAVDCFFAPK